MYFLFLLSFEKGNKTMRQFTVIERELNTINTQAYEPHMFSSLCSKWGKDYDYTGSKDKYKRKLG